MSKKRMAELCLVRNKMPQDLRRFIHEFTEDWEEFVLRVYKSYAEADEEKRESIMRAIKDLAKKRNYFYFICNKVNRIRIYDEYYSEMEYLFSTQSDWMEESERILAFDKGSRLFPQMKKLDFPKKTLNHYRFKCAHEQYLAECQQIQDMYEQYLLEGGDSESDSE
jgi:hypothetical protein